MSLNLAAFLLGLFIVPIALLAMGHKLRRRSSRAQKAFWGGIVGYSIAGIAAVIYGMIPPENWVESETARGFIGYWGMLVLPILGSIVAMTTARSDAD